MRLVPLAAFTLTLVSGSYLPLNGEVRIVPHDPAFQAYSAAMIVGKAEISAASKTPGPRLQGEGSEAWLLRNLSAAGFKVYSLGVASVSVLSLETTALFVLLPDSDAEAALDWPVLWWDAGRLNVLYGTPARTQVVDLDSLAAKLKDGQWRVLKISSGHSTRGGNETGSTGGVVLQNASTANVAEDGGGLAREVTNVPTVKSTKVLREGLEVPTEIELPEIASYSEFFEVSVSVHNGSGGGVEIGRFKGECSCFAGVRNDGKLENSKTKVLRLGFDSSKFAPGAEINTAVMGEVMGDFGKDRWVLRIRTRKRAGDYVFSDPSMVDFGTIDSIRKQKRQLTFFVSKARPESRWDKADIKIEVDSLGVEVVPVQLSGVGILGSAPLKSFEFVLDPAKAQKGEQKADALVRILGNSGGEFRLRLRWNIVL